MTTASAIEQPDNVKSLILALTDVVNRHDPDQAAAFYSEDAEVINHATGQHLLGRTAIREDLAALMTAWPDVRIEKTSLMAVGDTFADQFYFEGTHQNPLPGAPATGRPFRVAWAGFGQVRDDKIVRHELYSNMVEFLSQVGLLPAPGEEQARSTDGLDVEMSVG